MQIVNLTPHVITIQAPDLSRRAIYPQPVPARVSSISGRELVVLRAAYGIPLHEAPVWGGVVGLPDPVDGTIYVVSAIVASRCFGRA